MGQGRDCEMVERPKDKGEKARGFQEQKND